MDSISDFSNARPIAVAFTNCFDGTTFGRTVHLTPRDERRLRNVLAAVQDYGFVLRASFEPAAPGYGFADVIDHLRATIGAPFAEAALAAAERDGPSAEAPPVAVMPVWAFEPDPDNADVMLSSATLWNCSLLVEALRVADDDDPRPVPGVRERYERWSQASGSGDRLATVRLPGRDGSYVVFAAPAPG